jgi:hypothetical protein
MPPQKIYLYRDFAAEGDLTIENVRGAIVHKAGRKYLLD